MPPGPIGADPSGISPSTNCTVPERPAPPPTIAMIVNGPADQATPGAERLMLVGAAITWSEDGLTVWPSAYGLSADGSYVAVRLYVPIDSGGRVSARGPDRVERGGPQVRAVVNEFHRAGGRVAAADGGHRGDEGHRVRGRRRLRRDRG